MTLNHYRTLTLSEYSGLKKGDKVIVRGKYFEPMGDLNGTEATVIRPLGPGVGEGDGCVRIQFLHPGDRVGTYYVYVGELSVLDTDKWMMIWIG